MASNRKNNTSFTFTTFQAYEVKVPLFFRLEAIFMLKTALEKGQLWQPREPRVFDQTTSDQVHIGPEHVIYHQFYPHQNLFQLTRAIAKTSPSQKCWQNGVAVGRVN